MRIDVEYYLWFFSSCLGDASNLCAAVSFRFVPLSQAMSRLIYLLCDLSLPSINDCDSFRLSVSFLFFLGGDTHVLCSARQVIRHVRS